MSNSFELCPKLFLRGVENKFEGDSIPSTPPGYGPVKESHKNTEIVKCHELHGEFLVAMHRQYLSRTNTETTQQQSPKLVIVIQVL